MLLRVYFPWLFRYWCHEGWRWLTRKQPALNVGHHETAAGKHGGKVARRMAPRYWYPCNPASRASEATAATGTKKDNDAGAGVDHEGPSVDGWRVRVFDTDSPVYADRPVCHVSWYEAQAYCRYRGRRLPTYIYLSFLSSSHPLVFSSSRPLFLFLRDLF